MAEVLSALLIPTERPPVANDIKRALLTFDQVQLLSADDREFVDPAVYLTATTPMPMPFFMGGGPVLPMGKMPGYDDAFQALYEELKPAIEQGSVVVRGAPKITAQPVVGIGVAPNPEGWGDPRGVVHVFRCLLADPATMRECAIGVPIAQLLSYDPQQLAPGGRALTEGFGGPPPVADLNDGSLSAEVAGVVTRLAAARLGSTIKNLGICEVQGLFPLASSPSIAGLLDRLQASATQSLAAALSTDDQRDILRRALRVERIVLADNGTEAALSALSIEDVLRIRTSNWGRAAEGRAEFFAAIRKIAADTNNDSQFDAAVKTAIEEYEKVANDSRNEVLKVGLELGVPALASAFAGPNALIASIAALPSWGLMAGLAAIIAAGGKIAADGFDAFQAERAARKHIGKALLGPYQHARR